MSQNTCLYNVGFIYVCTMLGLFTDLRVCALFIVGLLWEIYLFIENLIKCETYLGYSLNFSIGEQKLLLALIDHVVELILQLTEYLWIYRRYFFDLS